jgi:hypothetical protein
VLASALTGLGWSREKVTAVCGLLPPAVPVGDFSTLQPQLDDKGRTALQKALSWLGRRPDVAKCKAERGPDTEDEPAWLRAKSHQEREDTAARYLKDVPFEPNKNGGDGSSQLVRKAAEVWLRDRAASLSRRQCEVGMAGSCPRETLVL